jgi:hypothetical protein
VQSINGATGKSKKTPKTTGVGHSLASEPTTRVFAVRVCKGLGEGVALVAGALADRGLRALLGRAGGYAARAQSNPGGGGLHLATPGHQPRCESRSFGRGRRRLRTRSGGRVGQGVAGRGARGFLNRRGRGSCRPGGGGGVFCDSGGGGFCCPGRGASVAAAVRSRRRRRRRRRTRRPRSAPVRPLSTYLFLFGNPPTPPEALLHARR